MSDLTVIGGLTALIVARDPDTNQPTGPLAGRVYRSGQVPGETQGSSAKVTFPYATILWPVTEIPALRGSGQTLARASEAQIDIWQKLSREADDGAGLWEAVRDMVDGKRLPTPDGLRATVIATWPRMPEPDDDILHHMLRVSVQRLVAANL